LNAPAGKQTKPEEKFMTASLRTHLRLPEELERLWCLSQAAKVGRTVYFAGFLPFTKSGDVEGGTLREQTAAIYRHVAEALAYFGASGADVVDETIFVTDMQGATSGGLEARNQFYDGVIPPPPMTLLGVNALAHPDAKVEIKLTVVLDDDGRSGRDEPS
jgi:2-iminobutanoate/2-iminopropanoate deaminase